MADPMMNMSYAESKTNSQSFADGTNSAAKGVKLPEISSNSKSGENHYRNRNVEV